MQTQLLFKRRFLLTSLFGSLFILVFIIGVTYEITPRLSTVFQYINYILSGFLCLAFLSNIIRNVNYMFFNRVGCVIDDVGLLQVTDVNKFVIEWGEIKSVRLAQHGNSSLSVIVIDLYDPETFMHGVPKVKSAVYNRNLSKYESPIVVFPSMYEVNVHELKNLLEDYLYTHRLHHSK